MLVVVVGVAMGCQDQVAKRDFDALKVHNEKLMAENAALQSEFEDFKAEQAEAPAPPPPEPMRTAVPVPAPVSPIPDIGTIRGRVPSSATVQMRGSQPVIRIDGALVCQGKNRAGLSAEGRRVLDQVAIVLNSDFAGSTVQVEGHTDSDPIRKLARFYKNNWELGYTRAQSVVSYLVSRGVSPSRLRATSFAEHRPVSTNKAKNRRVEIVVMPPGTAPAMPGAATASGYSIR
jgi:flagellar motor protein MotB